MKRVCSVLIIVIITSCSKHAVAAKEDGCCMGWSYVLTAFTRWRHGLRLEVALVTSQLVIAGQLATVSCVF